MRTKNPMRGLLTFAYYNLSGSANISILISLLLAIVYIVTGTDMLFVILAMVATVSLPMTAIMGMAAKDGKWEKFQLTLPVTRDDVLRVQYITIVYLSVVAAAIIMVAVVGGVVTQHEMFASGVGRAALDTLYTFGTPLMMTGLSFPLASSNFGKDRQGAMLNISIMVSVFIVMMVPNVAGWLDVSMSVVSAAYFGVAVVVFVGSYFVTRGMYARSDF